LVSNVVETLVTLDLCGEQSRQATTVARAIDYQ
jgi:hypothetical protein